MRPQKAKRVLFNGLRKFVNSGNTSLLESKECLNSIYTLLYKAMRIEGMDVRKMSDGIDVSTIQEYYMDVFDNDNTPLTAYDVHYYSDRCFCHACRLMHIYMAIINDNLVDDNKDRFLKL